MGFPEGEQPPWSWDWCHTGGKEQPRTEKFGTSVALLPGLLQVNCYQGVLFLPTRPPPRPRDSCDGTESNLAIIVLTGPLAYTINISFSLSVAGSPSPHLTGLRAKVEVTKGGGAGERLAHRHLRGWVM